MTVISNPKRAWTIKVIIYVEGGRMFQAFNTIDGREGKLRWSHDEALVDIPEGEQPNYAQ